MHKHDKPHGHSPEVDPEALKAGHEVGDVSMSPMIRFGVGVTVLAVISMAIAYGAFLLLADYKARTSPAPTPMQVLQQGQKPPEPRLQIQALKDWVAFKAEQDSLVTTYGWVDKGKGVVRIPLDRALDIMAGRPWPHQAGTYQQAGLDKRAGRETSAGGEGHAGAGGADAPPPAGAETPTGGH